MKNIIRTTVIKEHLNEMLNDGWEVPSLDAVSTTQEWEEVFQFLAIEFESKIITIEDIKKLPFDALVIKTNSGFVVYQEVES